VVARWPGASLPMSGKRSMGDPSRVAGKAVLPWR